MNNELYHHGVIGMKWGVRNDRRAVRTLKKVARAEKKYQKHFAKYGKHLSKASKYTAKQEFSKARKHTRKSNRNFSYASQDHAQAVRYAERINEKYGSVPINKLNSKQIYAGRKYCVRLVG